MDEHASPTHATRTDTPSLLRRGVDRGPRPILRGRLHENAAWYFAGTGTALAVTAAVLHGMSLLTGVTVLYVLCLIGMLTVSALYHRAPWPTAGAVAAWRRADHSMIAVFIAGTYGPIAVNAFDSVRDGLWILPVCWMAAAVAVIVNIAWIGHPRWLDVVIYLIIGWLAVLKIGDFATGTPLTAGILIVVGGLIYTAGAVVYGLQRPTFSERWFGFHELFHAATIVAAALHHVAIWLIILD
ncbi:hemolysin III family protein [Corynebacterium bovis]|uniref:PAQR family membrane homeostasis protein TrhA n=1 Tax=Corynebacterium bovis TaxID=36808 RepID=UPI00254DBA5E|nr:hemolysin III family protein [Corynebacterium bovis]MDK8511561.1 hemolysin III family protein [Corynebacterium bovis]